MGNSESLIGELLLKEKTSLLSSTSQAYNSTDLNSASVDGGSATVQPAAATAPVALSFSKPTPHLLMIEPALAWDPSSLSGCGTVELERQ